MPTMLQAHHWLQRWDRQQESYLPEREKRFAVIAEVVAWAVGRSDPTIVDLGAGPGSLSVRLLDRFPGASVVAVDADPLLLGLAATAYPDRPGLRLVRHDLRDPQWHQALDLHEPADAVVSTTALHWLTAPQLADVYRRSSNLLNPGGVLVNGDHLHDGPHRPRLDTLTRHIAQARLAPHGASQAEDWDQWWQAVANAPELEQLNQARAAAPVEHSSPDVPDLDEHITLLRAAGFAEVGTVWQHGNDRVLVALRSPVED